MLKKCIILVTLLLSTTVFASRNHANFKVLVNTGVTVHEELTKPKAILNLGTTFYKTVNPYDQLNVNLGLGAEIGSHFTKSEAVGVFSPFVSLELKRNITAYTDVYGGINLGTSTSFAHNKAAKTSFNVKTFVGLTFYDKVSIELGAGSPSTFSFGIGARIGL